MIGKLGPNKGNTRAVACSWKGPPSVSKRSPQLSITRRSSAGELGRESTWLRHVEIRTRNMLLFHSNHKHGRAGSLYQHQLLPWHKLPAALRPILNFFFLSSLSASTKGVQKCTSVHRSLLRRRLRHRDSVVGREGGEKREPLTI